MRTFQVSKSEIGLALTGMWAMYALLQFPSGLLADRVGAHRVVVAALALTGIASGLLAAAPSFHSFALFVVVLGAGAGLYFTVGTLLLTRSFERRGAVLGVHSAGGPTAGLIVPPVAATIAVSYNWHVAILIGATLSLLALVLFLSRIYPQAQASSDDAGRDDQLNATESDGGSDASECDINGQVEPVPPSALETIARLVRRPEVLYLTLIGVIVSYAWQAFTSFFPTFLVESHSFTVPEASLAFGVVFLLSALAQPTWGRLADRFSSETVLALLLSVAALGLGTVLIVHHVVLTVLGIGLLGLGMSWGGVLQSRFMELFSNNERGSAFGLVRTIYMLLGAAASFVTGSLTDRFGWSIAYGLVVGLLAIVVLSLVVRVARSRM